MCPSPQAPTTEEESPLFPVDLEEFFQEKPQLMPDGGKRESSLIKQILKAVRGPNGEGQKYEGITFRETGGNVLNQILQTPNLWGKSPDYAKVGRGVRPVVGEDLVDTIRHTIEGAQHVVDILTMWPFPNGHFLKALKGALQHLAADGRPVVVRILVGKNLAAPLTLDPSKALRAWVEELVQGLPLAKNYLSIFAGFLMTSATSWNHAKVIAVDGRTAIVGGHNLWSDDYLEHAPVHDVSLRLSGPAVYDAHQFASALWRFAAEWVESKNPTARVWSLHWRAGKLVTLACPEVDVAEAPPLPMGSNVLALGRLGKGMTAEKDGAARLAAQASDTAKIVAVRWATKSIKLSQQDLISSPRSLVETTVGGVGKPIGIIGEKINQWIEKHPLIDELAQALLRGVEVYIVMSPADARTTAGSPYTTGVGVQGTVDAIRQRLAKHVKSTAAREYTDALKRLHVAPIQFTDQGNAWKWRDPESGTVKSGSIQNHAKVYIVDDEAFYVGSDNLYPYAHQEFGYLVEEKALTQQFLQQYWEKLWSYSKAHEAKVV